MGTSVTTTTMQDGDEKTNKKQKKKPKQQQQYGRLIQEALGIANANVYKYAYELQPSNFEILTDEKKMRLMYNWWQFLRYVESDVRITLTYDMMKLPDVIAEQRLRERHEREEDEEGYDRVPVLKILLDSLVPLDEELQANGLRYKAKDPERYPHKFYGVTREKAKSFRYEANGKNFFGRVYSLTSVPRVTRPAWVFELLNVFQRVEIRLYPLENDVAIKKINARRMLFSDNKGRETQQKLDALNAMEEGIIESKGFAIEWGITGYLFGTSAADLKEWARKAGKFMRANGITMQASWYQQRNILDGRSGARYLSDTLSTGILYPLASAEMIESGGVYLGTNTMTSSPVFFDINVRQNHNVFTAGQTGSGKSFTNKILLKRFMEQAPSSMCMIIDPQGEYMAQASYFGLDAIELQPGQQYGLDPFKIYDSPVEAADILAVSCNVPDTIRKQWASIAEKCTSINDLYEKYEPGQKYLTDLVSGPLARMFQGEPKFTNRMIISLKRVADHEFTPMFILMILVFAWKMVNTLPDTQWKFILLDEAWMMKKLKDAMGKIAEIARQGRKKSLVLAISTQNLTDLDAAVREGKLTEFFDTKIVMSLASTSAQQAASLLELNEEERENLTRLRTGHGMISTGDNRLYCKFEATQAETLRYFNTKAEKEVG